MTKCGRYGSSDFDYSPKTIRRSVERSLARFHTTYLDTVYLHDVEFVATPVAPRTEGVHLGALGSEAEAYGLNEGQEAKMWGEGDQKILDAVAELRKLQEEGVVKSIGITGAFPLTFQITRLISLLLTSVRSAAPDSASLGHPCPEHCALSSPRRDPLLQSFDSTKRQPSLFPPCLHPPR